MPCLNFSDIPSHSLLGRLARAPLRLIPKQMVAVVLQGELKGARWIVGSGVHGYWLGSYEFELQRLVAGVVQTGDVVYDIGAHVGFYTLLASRLVGAYGRVVAFEPLPENIEYLKRHLTLNRCANVDVCQLAVSDGAGTASFTKGPDRSQGHLSHGEAGLQVRTCTLDDLIQEGRVPSPDFLKVDVEGSEVRVLNGARRMLADRRPAILMATHGPVCHMACLELLTATGYRVVSVPAMGTVVDALLAMSC